ncbi:MAG: hypothetical protein ABSA21_11605 [Candidatus Limnocylindrales bacterium]|jgi:hypothetical protein
MERSRLQIGWTIALGFLVAACSAASGTVAQTATPSPGLTSAPPATSPTAPSSLAPSASSQDNGEPQVPSWMNGSGSVEAQLLANLRDDAKVGCAPTKLFPVGAVAGAECRPNTALVAILDVYGFGSPDDALDAYRARLAAEGVQLRTGDCLAGQPGDEAWTPGDGQWGPGGVEPDRDGCFVDVSAHANVLALCGNGAYIGIVGKTADVAALAKWAWRFPAKAMNAGQVSTPSPPGICYAGWGA